MSKKIVKRAIKMSVLSMMLVLMMMTTVFGACKNDCVHVEKYSTVKGSIANGFYATGYVTCKPYHYAQVFLIEKSTGKIIKKSEKKFGYGKQTVSTDRTKKYAIKSKLDSIIISGWK